MELTLKKKFSSGSLTSQIWGWDLDAIPANFPYDLVSKEIRGIRNFKALLRNQILMNPQYNQNSTTYTEHRDTLWDKGDSWFPVTMIPSFGGLSSCMGEQIRIENF